MRREKDFRGVEPPRLALTSPGAYFDKKIDIWYILRGKVDHNAENEARRR